MLAGLFIASRVNYLLFHVSAEVFVIAVAVATFAIAWNSRQFHNNNYFLVLGISLFSTAVILVFHLLAYPGMNILTTVDSTNMAAQFWLASRYILAAGLIASPALAKRKISTGVLNTLFLLTTIVLVVLVYTGLFPTAFKEATSLTAFKIGSEYVICLVFVLGIYMLYKIRDQFDRDVLNLTVSAIIVLIAAELAFTLYTDPYGLSNLSGHLLQFISFYFLYRAFIKTTLEKPYSLLLFEAKERERQFEKMAITDSLTGLYNYGYFEKQLFAESQRMSRYGRTFSLLIIDVDDFKELNDMYGHLCGDQALRDIAKIMLDRLRKIDIPARYGGDEFAVILPETDSSVAAEVAERIRVGISTFQFLDDSGLATLHLTSSIGIAQIESATQTPRDIIKSADEAMYKAKEAGKNLALRANHR